MNGTRYTVGRWRAYDFTRFDPADALDQSSISMTILQPLPVGAFLIAYYYFALRTHNTPGFRLFPFFFFISIAVRYRWYADYRALKNTEKMGITTELSVYSPQSKLVQLVEK